MKRQTRTFGVVATCVLLLHAAALWALQAGLAGSKPTVVVRVHLLARMVEPPPPVVPVPQPPVAQQPLVRKPTPPVPKPRTVRLKPAPVAKPTRQPAPEHAPSTPVLTTPMVTAEPTPIDSAPAAAASPYPMRPSAPSHGAPAGTNAAAAETAIAVAPTPQATRPTQAAVELPSSDAQYLKNPRPSYPPLSLRLREQGTVLVDVLVSEQGLASEAKVKSSSGFFRLDNAAVSTVLTWRFVPGKRAGVAQSMWFTVPISFSIQ